MRVRHGGGVQAGGDQAGEVRHVDHQVGADLVGDAPERREVELTRVGRPAGQNGLRAVCVSQPLDLLHVDQVILLAYVVRGDVVELAGEVQPHPVGEVTAVVEGLTQDRVPGLQQREHRRGVGLGTGMRLHVGESRAEQCLHPVDRQLLDEVNVLAAAVVAAPRVALGVLVCQNRSLGLHHRHRSEVFAGDHFQGALLPLQLGGDRIVHLGVDVGQGRSRVSDSTAPTRLPRRWFSESWFTSFWKFSSKTIDISAL